MSLIEFLSYIARGLSTGWLPVGPTKDKACKSIQFNEGISEIEIIFKTPAAVLYLTKIEIVFSIM